VFTLYLLNILNEFVAASKFFEADEIIAPVKLELTTSEE
jgi:hypothetical protein